MEQPTRPRELGWELNIYVTGLNKKTMNHITQPPPYTALSTHSSLSDIEGAIASMTPDQPLVVEIPGTSRIVQAIVDKDKYYAVEVRLNDEEGILQLPDWVPQHEASRLFFDFLSAGGTARPVPPTDMEWSPMYPPYTAEERSLFTPRPADDTTWRWLVRVIIWGPIS